MAINVPENLFDFRRLARVFVEQIVPTQVLSRQGSAAFFSPARVNQFGLP
jgi:hypothetical protein